MKIKIKGGSTYTLKPFEEITIADWRKVGEMEEAQGMKDQREALIALVRALTGIPASKLRLVPAAQFDKMLDLAGKVITATQEAAKSTECPKSFTLHGIAYTVPQDIEQDALHGQYEDLEKALMPMAKTEADILAFTCAVLCLPEGEEYDGEKVMERVKVFDALPIATAMRIGAFFFESSSAFKNVMARCISLYLTSKWHRLAPQPTA